MVLTLVCHADPNSSDCKRRNRLLVPGLVTTTLIGGGVGGYYTRPLIDALKGFGKDRKEGPHKEADEQSYVANNDEQSKYFKTFSDKLAVAATEIQEMKAKYEADRAAGKNPEPPPLHGIKFPLTVYKEGTPATVVVWNKTNPQRSRAKSAKESIEKETAKAASKDPRVKPVKFPNEPGLPITLTEILFEPIVEPGKALTDTKIHILTDVNYPAKAKTHVRIANLFYKGETPVKFEINEPVMGGFLRLLITAEGILRINWTDKTFHLTNATVHIELVNLKDSVDDVDIKYIIETGIMLP